MQLSDLTERVNLEQAVSHKVVDLRQPREDGSVSTTHIALTKDGGAIIFNWAQKDWKETITRVESELDKNMLDTPYGLRLYRDGIAIERDRDYSSWSPQRNKYSRDLKIITQRLLDLNLVSMRTSIYLGKSLSHFDEHFTRIGSVASIMKASEKPRKLVLYHGTSSARYQEIMKNGLLPLDTAARIWSRERKRDVVEHRDDSIYLTASLAQAEYYAKKAVSVDKKRFTSGYFSRLESRIISAHNTYRTARDYKNNEGMIDAQAEIEKLKKAKELLMQMWLSTGKLEPVVLEIEITQSEFKNLMADDDFLRNSRSKGEPANPNDWRTSLSHFGQVALKGSIAPERIKRIR